MIVYQISRYNIKAMKAKDQKKKGSSKASAPEKSRKGSTNKHHYGSVTSSEKSGEFKGELIAKLNQDQVLQRKNRFNAPITTPLKKQTNTSKKRQVKKTRT